MKTNKLIGILLFFLLSIFGYAATAPTINSFSVSESGSGEGKVKVYLNLSSSSSLTRVRAHCSTSSLVSTSSSYYYTYKDGSRSTGSQYIYLTNANWRGKQVYCKAEVEAGSGNKASYTIKNVQLSASKPTINSFSVSESGSGEGKVKVYLNLSSSSSLTRVRAHCSTSSLVSTSSYYMYKDGSNSTGTQYIYLNNPNWIGKRVYCKAEVEAGSGNKADFTIKNVSLSAQDNIANFLNFLNQDNLIKKMNLGSNLNDHLSRSDSVVLIDRMRVLVKSSAEKNMEAYYNPFADVPGNAEYLPSLARLAYYRSKSFNVNPIDKYNSLFNPMRHMTRQEFLKIAMSAFDIEYKSYDLQSKYSDVSDINSDFLDYFKTATYWGIISGNSSTADANGKVKVLPNDKISIQEALWILARIQEKFGNNYPFDVNSYDSPDSLDISKLFHKTIGYEYEPRYYKPDATPIDISSISKSKSGNYYVLTVNSSIDTGNGASDYYWWNTDKGYFKEVGTNGNFKTVHFYPLSTEPNSAYHIKVSGGDNLGYVDHATITIGTDEFDYPEERKKVDIEQYVQSNLEDMEFGTNLVANKLFTIKLSNVSIKKAGIELGVDQVDVKMEYGSKSFTLFHGTPSNKKVNFIVPDYPELYGKTNVTMKVELYSQAEKLSKSKPFTYIPQFVVRGKVYNAISGNKVTDVIIGGKSISLDENGEFYYVLEGNREVNGLEVRTKQNSQQNHFDVTHVDLTYASPSKYVVLAGEDVRPSLNLMVSPYRVPSNKSVRFTLTSDKVIPLDAAIDLEDSSCGNPVGLGSTNVEITCTTASSDSIKHILMSVNSAALYGDGLVRTIVVDKALNNVNDIDTVKEQLTITNYATENIYLPTQMLGVSISWSSNKTNVISNTGVVTQQNSEQQVILTATLRKDGVSAIKTFTVTVPAKTTTVVDTDNDGIPDSTDPDDDNDGILDVDEIRYGLDPLNPADANYDADGDGVSNIDEIRVGTDPRGEIQHEVRISSVSPLNATVGEIQNYTIYGQNLPQTIVGNIEGSVTHCSYVSGGGNSITIACRADVVGHKKFYLKEVSGGTVILGSSSIYVDVTKEEVPVPTRVELGSIDDVVLPKNGASKYINLNIINTSNEQEVITTSSSNNDLVVASETNPMEITPVHNAQGHATISVTVSADGKHDTEKFTAYVGEKPKRFAPIVNDGIVIMVPLPN